MTATGSIDRRASFERVRYANCWEDADILCEALVPTPTDGPRVLSIASGGDNAFALLAAGAREVVAADLSAAQLAVVELKAAAARNLGRDDALAFLGLADCAERRALLGELEADLSPAARRHWRARPEAVEGGIVHAGKFERYFHLFRRRVLPLVHRRSTVEALMEERDAAGRRAFYEETWNNRRWRWTFRIFFSRFVMGRLGRDPEFFRYVEGSVAERILDRCRHALTALPTHANPYLRYILTGAFDPDDPANLPRYLRPGPWAALSERLDRLRLVHGPVEAAGDGDAPDPDGFDGFDGFDAFNLSDIFEYLDPETSARLYGDLLARARDGARLAYWNMLVPRRRPPELAHRVRRLERSDDLFARDKAFFYSAFHVEEVLAGADSPAPERAGTGP